MKGVKIMRRPGDVIGGGAGGMGQCPLPQHQPQGKCNIPDIYMPYTIHITEVYHIYWEYTRNMSCISNNAWNIPGIYMVFDEHIQVI